MEPLQYIHSYIVRQENNTRASSSRALKQQQQQQHRDILFELPRFGMDFMLRGGQLRSLDFRDYVLQQQQQLVAVEPGTQRSLYTLPGLQQYLVLQRDNSSSAVGAHRANTLVLIPSGNVSLDESGSVSGGRGSVGPVTVQVPGSCRTKLQRSGFDGFGHDNKLERLGGCGLIGQKKLCETFLGMSMPMRSMAGLEICVLLPSWRACSLPLCTLPQARCSQSQSAGGGCISYIPAAPQDKDATFEQAVSRLLKTSACKEKKRK
eukprot:1145599-Pelagomonas_calceolata.AAC.1